MLQKLQNCSVKERPADFFFFRSGESSGTWVLSALPVAAAALGKHVSETTTESPQVGRLTFQ